MRQGLNLRKKKYMKDESTSSISKKRIFLGAHMSIAGGLEKSLRRIKKVGGTALQIFTKNQRQWRSPSLTESQIEAFLSERFNWGPYPIFSHTSYLLNLASPEPALWKKSLEDLKVELCRALSLRLEGVVTHPGSHRGEGIKAGIERIVKAIDIAIEETGFQGKLLLETTCGQGYTIGGRFEELEQILYKSKFTQELQLCIDTAHIFAAGYDIKNEYEKVMEQIDNIVGIENIGLFHLNDNKYPLFSRRDRHAHIGEGEIGIEPFMLIMQDIRLKHIPRVIETPKGKGLCFDMMNLDVLLSMTHDE